ncbi:hypothetical protein HWD35_24590 [Tsukamurella tyrosinosolvens]|uniref:hypothetical protein n=1 Tax=Tsukamurella TaxID=2060 RepID=UPI000E19E325|nr:MULTISPECIES: hypothetical protein [Tsukamurella]MCA4997901.1 hypothetical protein [Tsukamurella tyrosinosolvens]RDH13574.1 hypothetical protein DVB88_01625 [Tsukamurella pulmonis]
MDSRIENALVEVLTSFCGYSAGQAQAEVRARLSEMAGDTDDVAALEQRILGVIPPGAVMAARHMWTYLEAEFDRPVDPANAGTGSSAFAEADVAMADTLADPADYSGIDPIEDVAIAPEIRWTDADKRRSLEEYARNNRLTSSEWVDMEWPPQAQLLTPGYLCDSCRNACATHEELDEPVDGCADCDEAIAPVVESNAVWNFNARVTRYELAVGANGRLDDIEVGSEVETVTEIEQDPRTLRIGPPQRRI